MASFAGNNDRLMDKLRTLQVRYQADLAQKLAALDVAWQPVGGAGCSSDELRHFHLLLHRLAGSGATFGFVAISEISQVLETIVLRVLNDGASLDDAGRRTIRDGLDALQDAVRNPEPIANTLTAPDRSPEGSE